MDNVTEDLIIAFLAVCVSTIALVTWGAIAILAVRRSRNYYMIAIDLVAVFLMAWYSVGYAAILFGQDLEGLLFFGPVTPILLMVFTGIGVLLHNRESNAEYLAESRRRMRILNTRLMGLEELENMERTTAAMLKVKGEDG